MIIDPPSPFAPAKDWSAHLESLKLTEPQTGDERRALAAGISEAKEQLRRKAGLD